MITHASIVTLVLLLLMLVQALPSPRRARRSIIVNQDGLGSSGAWKSCTPRVDVDINITARELDIDVVSAWPADLKPNGGGSFAGGVVDSTHVWFVPNTANGVVRIDRATHNMSLLSAWPTGLTRGDYAFQGAVFDSTHVWLVPCAANAVVRIDVVTLAMSMIDSWPPGCERGMYAFTGGVFDGSHVWLVPLQANGVVRVDVAAHNMTLLKEWPARLIRTGNAFAGGLFDSSHVWLVPSQANAVVRIDPKTLNMTMLDGWPTGLTPGTYAFFGGAFDGTRVWLAPYNANGVVHIDVATLNMTLLTAWPRGLTLGNAAFSGAIFDSAFVWLVPYQASGIVRISVATQSITLLDKAWPKDLDLGAAAFAGAVFDSTHIWLVPYQANATARVRTNMTCSPAYAGWGTTLSQSASMSVSTFTPSDSSSSATRSRLLTKTHSRRHRVNFATAPASSRLRPQTLTRHLRPTLPRRVSTLSHSVQQTLSLHVSSRTPQFNLPTVPQPQGSHSTRVPSSTAATVILVLGSSGAFVAATLSPASANKPVSVGRITTASVCPQFVGADDGAVRQGFPGPPSAWSLLPSVSSSSDSEISSDRFDAVASRAATTMIVAAVVMAINALAAAVLRPVA